MSLGYARDSIADLQKLYHSGKEEEENFFTTAPAATKNNNNDSINDGNSSEHSSIIGVEEDDHDFLFFDQEEGDLNDVIHLLPVPGEEEVDSDIHNGDDTNDNTIQFASTLSKTEITNNLTTTSTRTVSNDDEKDNHSKSESAPVAATTKTTTTTTSNDNIKISPSITTSTKSSSSNDTPANAGKPLYYSNFDYTSYQNDYNNSYIDPYAPNILSLTQSSSKSQSIFCCFFPNHDNNKQHYDDESDDESDDASDDSTTGTNDKEEPSKDTTTTSVTTPAPPSANDVVDDDDLSIDVSHHGLLDHHDNDISLASSTLESEDDNKNNENDMQDNKQKSKYVEQLELEKEKENVNESTIVSPLKQPSSNSPTATPTSPPSLTPTQLLDKQPVKGILKRPITKPEIDAKVANNSIMKNSINSNNNGDQKRRSILPSYDKSFDDNHDKSEQSSSPKEKKRVVFSPMARVVNVMARSEMSYMLRSLIWWQRNDYDDFKKTGRIIAQAMLCGGSEIWLQTSDAWGKKQGQSPRNLSSNANGNVNQRAHLQALQRYGVKTDVDNNEEKDEDVGSKWWCKFGHSRRGLEHIVSIEEGKQRQRFVTIAVRAVLDEQRRQRITRKDPQKIATVSMQYTSWARDLAHAAAAADAEAVKSNFDSKAKCRVEHLKRNLSRRSNTVETRDNTYVPSANFVLSANSALTAKVLDANTHSNLRMQDKEVGEEKRSATPDNLIAKKAAGFQFQDPDQNVV